MLHIDPRGTQQTEVKPSSPHTFALPIGCRCGSHGLDALGKDHINGRHSKSEVVLSVIVMSSLERVCSCSQNRYDCSHRAGHTAVPHRVARYGCSTMISALPKYTLNKDSGTNTLAVDESHTKTVITMHASASKAKLIYMGDRLCQGLHSTSRNT